MKDLRILRMLLARVAGRPARQGSLVKYRAFLVVACLGALLGNIGCIGLAGNPGGSSSGSGSPSQPSGSASSSLSASSTQLSFGNVTVGSPTALLVSFTDAGKANVTISSVTATGSGFSVSGGSNTILTPNQSVTVSVNFAPASAGTMTGDLSIVSNASDSPLHVSLSGNGVSGSVHAVTLNWQPSTSPVIGYFVYRGTATTNMSKLNAIAEPSTSYTDAGVAGGQTYVYAVTAVDSNDVESTYSNEVAVTIPGS